MAIENADLLRKYFLYLRVERRMSENTIANYKLDLEKFSQWLSGQLTGVQRTDVQRYLAEMLTTGKSARSAARYLACLRNFYRFLIDESDVEHDPTRNIPVAKTWQRVPQALSQADLESMVSSMGSSWMAIRDKAILLTFFDSGLRASELVALKLQHVDLDAGIIKVWNGKGGKDGIAPLSDQAISAIRIYLETVRPRFADRDPELHLFLGQRGSLTRQQVWNRVSNIAQAALGKHVHPHQLRHGFATVLVEGGADIRDVQVLMRHSSVDTTQIYVHIDLTLLRRVYYATHPRARIAAA